MKNHFTPPFYKLTSSFNLLRTGLFHLGLVLMVFTSCIEEPTEKFEVPQQDPKLALVKNWFDSHKNELRIGDSRDSYRTESHELILPFFEKEPDWEHPI